MKKSIILTSLVASIFAAGCAATDAEEAEEVAASSEEALSAANIYGAWEAETGPIYNITFTRNYAETLGGGLKGKSFEATVDNGIRCITTPCPATDSVAGVYKVTGGSKLTLASYDRPSLAFSRYLGDYRVSLAKGKLTLKKLDGTVQGTFHKAAPVTGEKCGTTVCGAGLVCCNPLRNICTPPGMMCIQ